jgi:uncharacterized hydrophobic protein (TIGR00341 family)
MRLLRVAVPPGKTDAIRGMLDDRDLEYTVTDEITGRELVAVVSVPLPTEAVESVLDALRETGVDTEAHAVVIDVKTVLSPQFEDVQEDYDETESGERIAHEEIRTQAEEFIPPSDTYFLLTVVSAVVATAGMLLDSPAVVVGSMVIAPLIGPAMATSVGTVLYDQDLFRSGVRHQVLGFLAAALAATLFALVIRHLFLVPPNIDITSIEQVSGRLTPDLLTLAVALGSGFAGARSLSSDVSTALVGVMIAAALIPPVGAIGIGFAWWRLDIVFRAGLLVLVNVLAINLSALSMLWYSGYRPTSWYRASEAETATRKRLVFMLAGLLVLGSILAAFTFTAYQVGASDQAIREDVQSVLDEEAYSRLSLIEVNVRHEQEPLTRRPVHVSATVARPGTEPHPGLADRIDAVIEGRSGNEVDVQIQYVDVAQSSD